MNMTEEDKALIRTALHVYIGMAEYNSAVHLSYPPNIRMMDTATKMQELLDRLPPGE